MLKPFLDWLNKPENLTEGHPFAEPEMAVNAIEHHLKTAQELHIFADAQIRSGIPSKELYDHAVDNLTANLNLAAQYAQALQQSGHAHLITQHQPQDPSTSTIPILRGRDAIITSTQGEGT